MTIKFNPIVLAILLLGVCVLAIALTKGCKNADAKNELISSLQDSYSKSEIKRESDSMAAARDKAAYEDSLSVVSGLLSLKDNQLKATEVALNASNDRIQKLIQDRSMVTPSDSNTTLVPNEYIEDCESCWTELKSQNKLVNEYQRQVAEKDSFSDNMTVIYNKRIDVLESEKRNLNGLINDYKEIAQHATKIAAPRRTMYFTMSAIGKETQLIMGVGAGLIYQDKRKRMYGATAYGTNQGTIYTGSLMLPLSFRRK